MTGHVITVAASEMENSEDADFCRAIDEKLMLVEDVDPQVAAVMEVTYNNFACEAIAGFFTTATWRWGFDVSTLVR